MNQDRILPSPIRGCAMCTKRKSVLPVNIRNISGCTVETFKLHLDRFHATVPDEPQVRGYIAMRRAESNSLLHMAQLAGPQRV